MKGLAASIAGSVAYGVQASIVAPINTIIHRDLATTRIANQPTWLRYQQLINKPHLLFLLSAQAMVFIPLKN